MSTVIADLDPIFDEKLVFKPIGAAFAQVFCKPQGRFQTYPETFCHRGKMTKAC
jgi:hypothetical protein